MTPESNRLVQESWTLLAADTDAVARRFYDGLFELSPHTRTLFAHTDLEAQRRKFVQMLADVLQMIDAPERCVPELAALARRHVGYGAISPDYDTVGAALLGALEQSLGDAFTPRVREAWMETYRMIAGIMRRAAERMPATLTEEMPIVRE